MTIAELQEQVNALTTQVTGISFRLHTLETTNATILETLRNLQPYGLAPYVHPEQQRPIIPISGKALDDARPKNFDIVVSKAPPTLATTPRRNPVQRPFVPQKTDGFGSHNPYHKHPPPHHPKAGIIKCNHPSIGVSPFPVTIHYPLPPMLPVFQPVVPTPHIPVHEYAYQHYPGNFDPHMLRSPYGTPVHTFGAPLGHVGAMVYNRSFQPPPRETNAYAANFANRRQVVQAHAGRLHKLRRHHRAFNPRENISMHHSGPRPFVWPPPYLGPSPGLMEGPCFSSPTPMYHHPNAVGDPPLRVIQHPQHPWIPATASETLPLRANIVKQIGYYFSNENLQKDNHLISLMDDQGWVPITNIADFNRVKRMTSDISLILDAMHSSSTVEVQDDRVRKRDGWSEWLLASGQPASSNDQKMQADVHATMKRLSECNDDSDNSNSNALDKDSTNLIAREHAGKFDTNFRIRSDVETADFIDPRTGSLSCLTKQKSHNSQSNKPWRHYLIEDYLKAIISPLHAGLTRGPAVLWRKLLGKSTSSFVSVSGFSGLRTNLVSGGVGC